MTYKPMNKKGDINAEDMLIQGAFALDEATQLAAKNNDVESLMSLTALWVKMSEEFHIFAAGAMPDHAPAQSKIATGFQKSDIIVEGEEDARSNEG